jgi:hypothetical protein
MGVCCEATEDLHASTPRGVGGFLRAHNFPWRLGPQVSLALVRCLRQGDRWIERDTAATAGGTRLLWTTRIDALFGSIIGLGCLGLLVALPGLPWSPPSALVLHWLHLKLLNIARTVKCYSKLTLSTKVPLKSKKRHYVHCDCWCCLVASSNHQKKCQGMGRACAYGSERERKRDRHLGETL